MYTSRPRDLKTSGPLGSVTFQWQYIKTHPIPWLEGRRGGRYAESSMHRLKTYIYRYRYRYVGGILCLFVTATLAMLIPYLLKRAVDTITQEANLAFVTLLALTIIAIALVQGVFRTFSRFVIFNVGRDIEYDLRNDLFAHLQSLPVAYYQRQQTGDLMSRLINDITAVRMLLGPAILNFLNTPLYYLYAVSVMASMDVPLTVMALLPYPLLLLVVKHYSRQLMEKTLRVQEGLADMSSRVQETVSGIHVVKAYVREEGESREFSRLNDAFLRQSLELARVRGMVVPVIKVVSSLGILVVLWYGGHRAIAGHLSLGDLVAFIGYLHLLAWPTMALGWMLSVFQRGRAALVRLEEIFSERSDISDVLPAEDLQMGGDMEFHRVDFAHHAQEDGRQVLEGVSFSIPRGCTVAVVGRTGAGKTTLVHLLPRLFDVSTGAITLGGRDIRTIPLKLLRRSIGFVPQEPFLFSTTLANNIAFGIDHMEESRVRWAAACAGLDRDIEGFPRGYETVVGERGITLSGGQKQRVTLARALAIDPQILVLDDALSSVDTQTEREILGHLRKILPGKTAIFIAHRISTIQDADLIIVLDDGRVVEMGDHVSLLRQEGLYAQIFRQQRLEEELAEL